MAFTQLSPPIPLHVLGKGAGFALAVIDYGQEHDLIWVTAITATGEIWCAPNPRVRIASNWTMGRGRAPALAEEEVGCEAGAAHAGEDAGVEPGEGD